MTYPRDALAAPIYYSTRPRPHKGAPLPTALDRERAIREDLRERLMVVNRPHRAKRTR